MDLRTLARAYDRSAATYDERFRALQRPKYLAALKLLEDSPHAARALARTSSGVALLLDAGAGTGLFSEWLCESPASEDDNSGPPSPIRARLASLAAGGRLIALDASVGMVRRAIPRGARALAADLAHPPLAKNSFGLVVSFTALLENVPESLRALTELLRPGGLFCASFLARESPKPELLCHWSGLVRTVAPLAAGQDLVHLLLRE